MNKKKNLNEFIERMPKIELHVHLEGSVQPETLLELALKNGIALPAETIEDLRKWFVFRNFNNFIEVYLKISQCIRTPDDIEYITREFLKGQKKQNIIYTEITYTPYTHYIQKNLSFSEQLAALEQARKWGRETLGIECRFIMDICRDVTPREGLITAEWLVSSRSEAVVALGLGGPEAGFPPERHRDAFESIKGTRIASVPHGGEIAGPESVWGALKTLNARRIGHGVRSWEDPELIDYLRETGIPLEVCPTSNLRLNVYPDIDSHVLPKLVESGVRVTINSDDPVLFNTTLTDEYLLIVKHFGYNGEDLYRFNTTALEAALLGSPEKEKLRDDFEKAWNTAG